MNPILEKIQADITAKVDPSDKEDFLNAIKAGRHILYDPSTHQNMELIKNPASRKDPVNTVSKGVAGLGYVMYQQSNRQMSPNVLIPALMMLACDVLDFGEMAGWFKVDAPMVAAITKELVAEIFKKLGVKPEDLQAAIQKGKSELDAHQAGQEPGATPGQGQQSGQEPPPPDAGQGMLPTAAPGGA